MLFQQHLDKSMSMCDTMTVLNQYNSHVNLYKEHGLGYRIHRNIRKYFFQYVYRHNEVCSNVNHFCHIPDTTFFFY